MTEETETTDLAPIPEHIEEEDTQALFIRGGMIDRLAKRGEKELEAYLELRQKALDTIQTVAIKQSHPFHWTKYRDRDGKVVCVVRDQGCVEMRKWLGISITNYNPKSPSGEVEPKVSYDDSSGKRVIVVEMWADGACNLTGEQVTQAYYAARSDDDFIGRKGRLQDLKASCRTGLDAKITRILSGLRKVPEEILQKHGVQTENAYKGHGYGTSTERTATKVAETGVKEKAKLLGEEILKATGGDKEAAGDLLKEITANPPKFKGFNSIERMTQLWQVDTALEKLKKHPTFGDKLKKHPTFGDHPEPGSNDDVGEGNGRLPY
jgi:hypothetical protein